MTADNSPMLSQPRMDNAQGDLSPMISGRGTRIIASARGAYVAGSLSGMIAQMPPPIEMRLRTAIVRQAMGYVRLAVARRSDAWRVRPCLDAASEWLEHPSIENARRCYHILFETNLVPEDVAARDISDTFLVNENGWLGQMMLTFVDSILAADTRRAAWAASAVAQFVPVLQGGDELDLYVPGLLSAIREASEASERWQIEAAWAILHGKQPPPIEASL